MSTIICIAMTVMITVSIPRQSSSGCVDCLRSNMRWYFCFFVLACVDRNAS